MTLNKATFHASIPPIMSGIKTGGDGMRVQFDIPESEMDETLRVTGVKWDGDVYMPGLSGETPPAKSYIALDEGNKFMIDGRFTRTQPVNLTPGALGVRCEE